MSYHLFKLTNYNKPQNSRHVAPPGTLRDLTSNRYTEDRGAAGLSSVCHRVEAPPALVNNLNPTGWGSRRAKESRNNSTGNASGSASGSASGGSASRNAPAPVQHLDKTPETREIIEYLQQVWPKEEVPRTPDEPWIFGLEIFEIVWYQHFDKTWHLAYVSGDVNPDSDLHHEQRKIYEGHKLWFGITRSLDSRNPSVTKRSVLLCPTLGNAKPDNYYTRLLLQLWGHLPEDKQEVERMVQRFEEVMRAQG